MRNRISIVLAYLCMLIFLVPCISSAETQEYTVYVGGKEMKASKDGTIVSYYVNGTDSEAGTVTYIEPGEWNAKLWYGGDKLMLEIKDLIAKGDIKYSLATKGDNDNTPDVERCAGIYADDMLYMIVRGENHVEGVEYDETYNWSANGNTVVNYTGDSASYGIYARGGITIGSENDGNLNVETEDIDGSCYGLYSGEKVMINNGTLNFISGQPIDISSGWKQNSIGLYTKGGLNVNNGIIKTCGASAMSISAGIYSEKDIVIYDGKVEAVGSNGYASGRINAYSYGIYALDSQIIINAGEIKANSGNASTTATGIYSGNTVTSDDPSANSKIIIKGGTVIAHSGKTESDQSSGIYSEHLLEIKGGTVEAYGGEATSDFSQGIAAYDGIDISGGKVIAEGNTGLVSVGLYSDWDLNVSGEAEITAKAQAANVYSYGTWVWRNFHMSGNASIDSSASTVEGTSTNRPRRSIGFYMSDGYYESDPPYVDDTFVITGGTFVSRSNNAQETAALGFYDVKEAVFSDEEQQNDKWYQWKTEEQDTMTLSWDTAFVHERGNLDSQYLKIEPAEVPKEPVYKEVTFKVVNGTWVDGTSEDIIVKVELEDEDGKPSEEGTASLKDYIPTGMKANEGYGEGSWDVEPPETVRGTDAVTYTYTFKKQPVYKEVTFKVENGTWSDGETEDITVKVELTDEEGRPSEEGVASLEEYIPTGMLPNEGYEGGTWDIFPPETVRGTDTDTYTYTFTKIPDPIYKEITFKVVNGTWADGTSEDKTVKVELTDEEGRPSESGTGTLPADKIPTGMNANEGYEGGTWDKEIPTTVNGVDDEVYTYTFVKKEESEQPPVDPDDPEDSDVPDNPSDPDAPAVPDDPIEPDDPADPKESDDTTDSNDFDDSEKSDNDEADDSYVPNEPKDLEKPDIDDATDSGDDFDLAALLGIMMFAAAVMTATVTIRKRG